MSPKMSGSPNKNDNDNINNENDPGREHHSNETKNFWLRR